jgi:hypothetical protein
MENLLSCKIKQIQTDGGGEYNSHPFKQFLATHGIHHRITCPHTSQQNGIAERKHRHVIETSLALLAQSHLPPKFWVEACLTAVYLINRMPSHTLQNLTPYTKLFKAKPSYSELRVFGCACYPLLQPYNKHKLEFRSKQCIFLGYSSNHKCYRCMDPNTSRIYLSRNVVFDENLFSAHTKATATLPSAKDHSPPLGIVLLPSYFFSINSLPTSHTRDTTVCPTGVTGLSLHSAEPTTPSSENLEDHPLPSPAPASSPLAASYAADPSAVALPINFPPVDQPTSPQQKSPTPPSFQDPPSTSLVPATS